LLLLLPLLLLLLLQVCRLVIDAARQAGKRVVLVRHPMVSTGRHDRRNHHGACTMNNTSKRCCWLHACCYRNSGFQRMCCFSCVGAGAPPHGETGRHKIVTLCVMTVFAAAAAAAVW
jgi:hypothetical protein